MGKKVKKEIIEWVILICVVGTVYLTGWHTELLGSIQRLLLSTKLIEAEKRKEAIPADFNLTIEDQEGNPISLQSKKGEVIFINFWATWCPPCIAELPSIQQLFNEKGGEVTFFMISLDKDPAKAKKYIEKKGYSFPVYYPASTIPNSFTIDVIPTTYVIDKGGLIQIQQEGMANYNTDGFKSMLEELAKSK